MTDVKDKIIEELQILQKKEQQDRNVFKARAYVKIIQQLQQLDTPVRSWDDLTTVTGVGDSIRKKIQEVFDTGVIAVAEKLRNEHTFDIKEDFMNIYGVGPVKAKSLLEVAKINSIAELRTKLAENPKLLNAKQTIGLKYYEDLLLRIPRSEMEMHEDILQNTAKDIFGTAKVKFTLSLVGSYRRQLANSGDIDALICFPDSKMSDTEISKLFKKFCKALEMSKYVEETLAMGDKKLMGISRVRSNMKARRLDLLVTPVEEYPYALLYFTGSDKFNIAMRRHALQRGYTMNEKGMVPVGEAEAAVTSPPLMKTEKDIFEFLEYPYVEPSQRDLKKIV